MKQILVRALLGKAQEEGIVKMYNACTGQTIRYTDGRAFVLFARNIEHEDDDEYVYDYEMRHGDSSCGWLQGSPSTSAVALVGEALEDWKCDRLFTDMNVWNGLLGEERIAISTMVKTLYTVIDYSTCRLAFNKKQMAVRRKCKRKKRSQKNLAVKI